jgi:sodium/proline symporter
VATLVAIGVVAARRTRTLRDYYAGGKRMGFFAVAFSARATGESAWLLLGVTGFGALYGVKGFWIVLGEVLGVGVAWLCLARRFKRLTDRYDSVTVPDYLESRFGDTGHALRLVAAAALLIFVPIYVSSQIHATGIAFQSFLGLDYYAGALIGFVVVLFYITRGGFVAVVWSDVFQGSLMVLGLVALPLVGVLELGGITNLLDVLRAHYPEHLSLTAGQGLTPLSLASIAGLVAIGLGFMGSPQVFVRYIALRSENEIGRGALVAIVWTILADSGAVCIGIVGRALITGDLGVASEDVLSLSVERLLHPFLVGLYVAAVLSAIMSTIDSLLVLASSAAIRDYYQKIVHTDLSDEDAHRYSSYLTAALAFAALGLAMVISVATRGHGVFWLIIFGWSGIAATFCPTLILSLFWPRMTARGAIAGMLAGFLAIPFFKFVAPRLTGVGPYFAQLEELAPAFLVSGTVVVLASLLERQPAPKAERAREDLRAAAG